MQVPIIEKRAGMKFERIGAPQPADMARIAAERSLSLLGEVDPAVVEHFRWGWARGAWGVCMGVDAGGCWGRWSRGWRSTPVGAGGCAGGVCVLRAWARVAACRRSRGVEGVARWEVGQQK